ncbi:MAG: acetylornithine transaminase [bacterium]
MPDTEEIINLTQKYLIPTYNRQAVVFERGQGCRLWDTEGRKYLDFVSGLGVNSLGYGYPSVVKAIQEQAEKLLHVSNLFTISQQARLAQMIVRQAFSGKMFFCNSGAEANEAAIKLARIYARKERGIEQGEIITAYRSFHGRTMATLTATGQEKVQKGFEPLLSGFRHVPFNDLAAVREAANDATIAVMIEPIQGEGGVHVGTIEYLAGLRDFCTRQGILLILDEVQTGIGRTGRFFCHQHADLEPDIVSMAKALGSGVPIGAILARDEVARAFVPGSHATTFGGNPLSCAAGIATVSAIVEDGILENCQKAGNHLSEGIKGLQRKYPFIKEVRGKGLLWGMELDRDGSRIVRTCLEKGLIINCTMGNVLRFLPPLVISREEIDEGLAVLDAVLSQADNVSQ